MVSMTAAVSPKSLWNEMGPAPCGSWRFNAFSLRLISLNCRLTSRRFGKLDVDVGVTGNRDGTDSVVGSSSGMDGLIFERRRLQSDG